MATLATIDDNGLPQLTKVWFQAPDELFRALASAD
jgi:hypothetical protein